MNQTDAILMDAIAEHLNRPRDGRLEQVVKERTGMSPTRLWARVNVLLDDPDVCRTYPSVVRILRSRQARGRRSAA